MTHEDAGKYSSKHPVGTTYDPAVAAYIQARASDGKLSCVDAHDGAAIFGVSPAEVGKTADLLECRVVKCQLGLYGYSPEKRIARPATDLSDDLRRRLEDASESGDITCLECWRIADEMGLERLAVAGGCEALGLKVRDCQLGAF